jgi:hypothetical protein
MKDWRRRGLKVNDAVRCEVIGGKGNYGRIGVIVVWCQSHESKPYGYDRAYVEFFNGEDEWLSASDIHKVPPLVALASTAVR